jgi:hypothetical protein
MVSKDFGYIANRIAAAKLNADGLASRLGHRGLEGQIRELAARECIEPFLTQSFQCGTGKVIDSRGGLSDQIDLVVYHRKVAPPVLVGGDLGLFPVECVQYAFEIKSRLTSAEIRDANKKFRSVANLVSFPETDSDGVLRRGPAPATVLLAFGSDMRGSEIERYIRHTPDEFPPCMTLCVLGRGYWYYRPDTKSWHGHDTHNERLFVEFCMFIMGFMNTLAKEESSLKPFLPGAYVDDGAGFSNPLRVTPHRPAGSAK